MITTFKRKAQGTIEAIQWTGENGQEIVDWAPGAMLLGDELTVPGKAGQMITVKVGQWVTKRDLEGVRVMTEAQLHWAYEEA